jgi:hypothetical protein
MQTSRHETEDGRHGFALEAALTQIAAKGCYLFVGSMRLLEPRIIARPQHYEYQSMPDVPLAR